MDLLDNINNIPRKSTKEALNYEVKGKKGINKLLFDFEKSCTFRHGDKITNLIKARILENYKKGSSSSPDSAKYICFEIPEFMCLEELINSSIFDTLEKFGKLKNLLNSEYNHLGIIYINQDGKYELYNATNEVLQYVKENLNREITQSQELFSKRIRGQEFKTRISKPVNEYIEEKQQIINERKKSVSLEEQYRYKIGNEVYTDYIGTDVTEGKILRINRLKQIDNTNDEKLYSAFIEKKGEEIEEEPITIGQIPKGFPILFTLTTTLEEYIKNGDEKEITKILQLITDLPKERLNINDVIYIGGIDAQGNIHRNMEDCLEETKETIKVQQSKYKTMIKETEISIR